ncbi:hypothetical protein HDU77_000319 [Chytriomyces hyalinus]|nr:hypothetical protein HDU77_000319 [Chytriomyces hyalinus]
MSTLSPAPQRRLYADAANTAHDLVHIYPEMIDLVVGAKMQLLTSVDLDFAKAPDFFSTLRPDAIDHRISNTVYAQRIRHLNALLHTSRVFHNRGRLLVLATASTSISSTIAIIVLLCLHMESIVAIIGLAAVIAVSLMVRVSHFLHTPKYIVLCTEHLSDWTRQDQMQGINLYYKLRHVRPTGFRQDKPAISIDILQHVLTEVEMDVFTAGALYCLQELVGVLDAFVIEQQLVTSQNSQMNPEHRQPPPDKEPVPEEAPAYESLPRTAQEIQQVERAQSVTVAIPAEAAPNVPTETDAPADTEPPPPEYDGPIPTGMVMLAVVKLRWEDAPAFFAVDRPSRLEDKISNVVYTTRMQTLNLQLVEDKIESQLKRMRLIRNLVVGGAVVIAATTLALFYTLRNNFIVYAGLFVFVLLLAFLPTTPGYVNVINKACSDWTREDKDLGINLVYMAKATKIDDSNRVDVNIVIVEPLLFYQSPNPMGSELPQYAPAT